MAKAPPEEQSQLKRRARRRLVGSIALVTVVAVVLPWVLEHEPRPTDQQIAIQIPSPNAGKFEPKPPGTPVSGTPVPAEVKSESTGAAPAVDSVPAGESAAKSVPADDALRAEQAKILSPAVKAAGTKAPPSKDKDARERETDKAAAEKKAAEKTESSTDPKKKPAEKAASAAEPKPAADSKPYVVQVAALVDAEKAAEIQKALAAKGLKVYTEKVKTANGEVTRVRVGPFPNRDAAEKERGRMKALGFDGNVAPK